MMGTGATLLDGKNAGKNCCGSVYAESRLQTALTGKPRRWALAPFHEESTLGEPRLQPQAEP